MTYKILNGLAPSYLNDLIKFYIPRRSLRSVEKGLLDVSHARKTNEGTVYYGNRNFKVTAPILYNKLPDSIKSASNVNTFKSSLKTYLFRQYF